MSYAVAIEQLNAMVPELYAIQGPSRRKFSLDEIRALLGPLENPHHKFPSVLIAGTNGKGSTASTLASILTASGLRTGLYTSPHLARVNERIRIDRMEVSDDVFAESYFRVHDAGQKLVLGGGLQQLPSFFEMLTAQAFVCFADAQVGIAVLEVGMGGRLDATNIVDPLLSIVTDVSLDHMEWLGSTIGEIAREKAGILRRGGTLIVLPQHPEANQVLGEVAMELDVRAVSATPYLPNLGVSASAPYSLEVLGASVTVASPLQGAHQHRNLALAIAAAVELVEAHQLPITPASIEEGIRLTSWPARLERVTADGMEWILDVAHNPAGAWALRAGLRDLFPDRQLGTLVFSCLRDKPVAEMAQILFPVFERVIFAPIKSVRAVGMDELMAAADSTGTAAVAAASVEEALKLARERAGGEPVIVSGSVYLVGEARSLLLAAREGQP
jgi:dihydrofolate synthase/folylpolyglutamate synthase